MTVAKNLMTFLQAVFYTVTVKIRMGYVKKEGIYYLKVTF